MNGDDISIPTTEEMEKYESVCRYLRGLVWTKSFPPSSGASVGENLMTSLT
jgi:hypothetical protein